MLGHCEVCRDGSSKWPWEDLTWQPAVGFISSEGERREEALHYPTPKQALGEETQCGKKVRIEAEILVIDEISMV